MATCKVCGSDYEPKPGEAHEAECCGAACYQVTTLRAIRTLAANVANQLSAISSKLSLLLR